MKNFNNFTVILGVIGVISGLWLIYDGQTFIGISGTITCVFVLLMGLGYIKTDNRPNQNE